MLNITLSVVVVNHVAFRRFTPRASPRTRRAIPIIAGWHPYNAKYREEVVSRVGTEKITKEEHSNNMYLAWMISKHRDFMSEAYVEWVEPEKEPFYIEDTEGHLDFNEKGYQAYKALDRKYHTILGIIEGCDNCYRRR